MGSGDVSRFQIGNGQPRLRQVVKTGARGLAIASDGAHAHAAHFNAGTGKGSVSVLRISPAGKLARQGQPVATGSNGAEAIALAEAGHRLYVANFNTPTDPAASRRSPSTPTGVSSASAVRS